MIAALRNGAQSASNTVAAGVSGPLDMMAAGLQKAGVPVPDDHVGGSKWMAKNGLTKPVPNGYPKLVGEAIGLTVPALGFARLNATKTLP